MKKMLKNGTFLLIMTIAIFSTIMVVNAGVCIKTFISISHNSTLTGEKRDYNYNSYSLDITPTFLEGGPQHTSKVILGTYLYQPEYLLGIHVNSTQLAYKSITIPTDSVGQTTYASFGSAGSGKRFWAFSTFGNSGAGSGSIKADVIINNWT